MDHIANFAVPLIILIIILMLHWECDGSVAQ